MVYPITLRRILNNFGDVIYLYDSVIPEEDRVDEIALLLEYQDVYQCFGYYSGDNKLVGMSIVYIQNELNNIHLDVIAVHPDYRGKGLSKELFNLLLQHFPYIKTFTIEAYEYNVEYFKKMGFHDTFDYEALYLSSKPSFLMKGESLNYIAKQILQDWQRFQCVYEHWLAY